MRWLVVWRAGEGNRAGVCASAAASADDQPYYEDGDEETNSAADDGIVDPLWEATSGRQGRRGWQGWRWGWWWLGHISHSLRSDASSRERRRAGETMAVFSFGQKLGPNLNGCPIKCCDEQSQMCDSIHSCIWELNLTFVYILCTQVQVHTVQHIQACRRGLVPALMPALISKEQWQCALVQRSRFVYKYISRAPAATPTDSARIYRSSFFLFPLRSKPASLQTSLRPSSL